MKCPNCGTPEQARVRVCRNCGTSYASQDLLEFRQLEFLIDETVSWVESAKRREPYLKRYTELMARILPAPIAPSKPAPAPITPPRPAPVQPPKPVMPTAAPARPAAPVAKPVPPAPPKPKAEAIPFDQWLLSERNIKFALYSGGLLFVLAGLIFIGLNWNLLSGPLKFVVTVFVTAFLYAGGLFLMSRKFLKIGGVAILTLASSFVPFNFAVLQIYNTLGISNEAMWLMASLSALAVYAVTTMYTRTTSLVYLSLLALASGVGAALAIFHATLPSYLLAFSILALGYLVAGRMARASAFTAFTRVPLVLVSQAAAPILFAVSSFYWLLTRFSPSSGAESWVALAAMAAGVAFYAAADWVEGWRIARWVVGAAFGATALFALFQLQLSFNWIGFAMSVTVLAYLIAAFLLEEKQSRADALPLLVEAQLAAPAVLAANAMLWAYTSYCTNCGGDNPWVAVAALFIGALFYVVTDRVNGISLARWVFGGTFAFAILVALAQMRSPMNTMALSMTMLALGYLVTAYLIEKISARKEAMPFLVEAQLAAPVLLPANALLWQSSSGDNHPWVAIGAMFLGAIFYAATDVLYRDREHFSRFAWGAAFAVAFFALLVQLQLAANRVVFGMTVLALAYLAAAYAFEKLLSRQEAMPLLTEAHIAAAVGSDASTNAFSRCRPRARASASYPS